MTRSTLSRVLSSSPVNATAARVTSRGIHFDPAVKIPEHHWHFDAPPPCVPISHELRANKNFTDLTGHKMGRMTVVGFYGARNKKRRALWLVKCACGDYETRSAAAIKANSQPDHCCQSCRYTRGLRDGTHYLRKAGDTA